MNYDTPALGRVQGKAVDIETHAKEILRLRELLNEILAKHTKQSIKKIDKDTDRITLCRLRKLWYGLIDEVIHERK